MHPRRIKSRSGISEIIGSLLMLVVVVALSSLVFAFATTNVGNFGTNFSNLFSNSGNALSQKIVIEQIVFNESGGALGANIYVRNVGSQPSIIASIYVNNITSSSLAVTKQISPTKQLSPGQFQNLAITFTPDTGSVYSFTIATQSGNTVVQNAKA